MSTISTPSTNGAPSAVPPVIADRAQSVAPSVPKVRSPGDAFASLRNRTGMKFRSPRHADGSQVTFDPERSPKTYDRAGILACIGSTKVCVLKLDVKLASGAKATDGAVEPGETAAELAAELC